MQNSWDATDPKITGRIRGTPWTLCVGAGICSGVMPSWNELAHGVISRVFAPSLSAADFAALARNLPWPAEGWLQAAFNQHIQAGGSHDAFHQILSDVIYEPLLANAMAAGCRTELAAALGNPQSLGAQALQAVDTFLRSAYGGSSVYQLANILNESYLRNIGPSAVITLNYDTLLFCLQRMFETIEYRNASQTAGFPTARYRQVASSLRHGPDKIPIFHIHGCLPPGRAARPGSVVAEEGAYLDLVQQASSWPQTTFTYQAQNSTLLFVGQSLADGNMRRWLAWEHARVSEEHRYHMSNAGVSPQPIAMQPRHWWIHLAPPSTEERALISRGLLHLGMNVAWVKTWPAVGDAVRNLLNL